MKIRSYKGDSLHPLIKEKIVEFSESKLPTTIDTIAESYLGAYLYNDNEEIVGGITGHSFWNMLHIDYFWIDENYRGKGTGSELLAAMEDKARSEKCTCITLETFSFEAPVFYEKNNYERFGVIENTPLEGIDYYFYRKYL